MVPDGQRSYYHWQSEIHNPKSEIRPAGGGFAVHMPAEVAYYGKWF